MRLSLQTAISCIKDRNGYVFIRPELNLISELSFRVNVEGRQEYVDQLQELLDPQFELKARIHELEQMVRRM